MANSAAPSIPLRRELRKPYFIYRTPDGIKSYLEREIGRALFSRKDPLTRFLAVAQLTGPQFKPPAIEYDLEGRKPEDFVRLDTISDAELAAFEVAARDFMSKAEPTAERVTPFERELRAHFRLPDPDKEPDSYWLYGPPHDRKLLILWGCEFEQNSSLPLFPGKGTSMGYSVVEKLQSRRMQWPAKQAQAIELARRGKEPIASFIATPTYDPKGALKSVSIDGKTYPAEAVSVPRHIPAGDIRRLASAAEAFYAKAYPDFAETTPFEKELRSALRFPDPEKKPAAYVLVKVPSGTHLHVIIDGKETKADTTPIIADDTLGMPAVENTPEGADYTPEPVVDQLKRRLAPKGKYAIMAGVAVVVLALGLVFSGLFSDKKPPVLDKIVAENDPSTVRIVFDKAMDPGSLRSTEEKEAMALPTPPAIPPKTNIHVMDHSGKRVDIKDITLDPADPKTVLLSLNAPLVEDSYTLYVENVKGSSGPAMKEKLEKGFDYRDRLPPKLLNVSGDSGDAHKLVLIFDEPLDDGPVGRTRNYTLPGFEFTNAELDPKNPSSVILTASTTFASKERYTITISDLRDRSKDRNEITKEITKDFVYVDSLPPKVEKVTADQQQIYVDVLFSEPVTEGPAQTPGNYVLHVGDQDAPFNAISAQLVDGERTVRLRVPPLDNGKDYTLKILNVTDRATPPNKIADDNASTFNYIGTPDKEGPVIDNVTVRGDGQRITLTFNEPVDTTAAFDVARYKVNDDSFKITQVAAAPKDTTGKVFVLTPDPVIPELKKFRLVLTNIPDLIGNLSPELTSREATRPGLGIQAVNVLGFRSIAAAPDGKTIEIEFTSEVTPASAKDIANYSVSDGIAVQSAAVDEMAHDYRRVTLVLDKPLGKKSYTLTCRNLARNDDPNKVQKQMTETFNGPGYSDF